MQFGYISCGVRNPRSEIAKTVFTRCARCHEGGQTYNGTIVRVYTCKQLYLCPDCIRKQGVHKICPKCRRGRLYSVFLRDFWSFVMEPCTKCGKLTWDLTPVYNCKHTQCCSVCVELYAPEKCATCNASSLRRTTSLDNAVVLEEEPPA